jgi:hypothetical protein
MCCDEQNANFCHLKKAEEAAATAKINGTGSHLPDK